MEYILGILILVLSGFGMFSMLGFAEEKFAIPSELADEVDNLERLFQDVFDYDSNSFFSVTFTTTTVPTIQDLYCRDGIKVMVMCPNWKYTARLLSRE